MSEIDWKKFWTSYRQKEVEGEEDLYFEVGKTVNGRPVSDEAFRLSIELIVRNLDLRESDRLLELCCGNGLMTRCFAPLVSEIEAVDFAEHLIEHARQFSAAANVRYRCADAVTYLEGQMRNGGYVPTKILLGDCLCYFAAPALAQMLRSVRALTENKFVFMASGAPCDDLKWNFYNTPERIRRFEENQLQPENTNDGIGRWWKRSELAEVARELDLELSLVEQPLELSNFRIDAVFHPRR